MNWNRKLKLVGLSCVAAIAILSCDKAPKGDDAKIADAEQAVQPTGVTYVVDTATSWVKFTGHGVGKNHPGYFKLNYGATAINKDSISGGSFVINVKSMRMEEKGEHIEGKLKPHLMSGDFFEADKFGTATFEITNVVPYKLEQDGTKSLVEGANFNISGNLKIKDVTKNITFPARVDLDGNKLKAKANFDIDRRQWNMNYGNDKTLGDKFISEVVNIEFYLEATQPDSVSSF
ncbi:YceI family protein [Chryseosolibacter indicus]|uniref:YceI family protein n=1 Tax=Chryseosolibacter indicus TaxID=2782351 RepID=A0ABS5VQD6_9BACT|nr:YceI family protein [Chryseosolibacter indicus]MBT1702226.1 YceI family protein [Chryseosolibacter indicus]